ncbi:MAG: hypothetical protein JW774_13890 [Candidatus Aureabacteria bacterium]|nr:hypothetical protein [Candidatus Auribacterota bacterium]
MIARILDFFHGTSSGRPTWLEIGCGDAQVSLEIAKRNPGANVLATDQYRKGDPRTDAYAKVTHDWEQGELQAQQSGLDNISIARAEFNILHEIPDHSLDYLLLINTSTPSALQDLCSYKRLIQQKLKIGGVILWYPYNNPEIYVDVNNHYHFQKTENFSWLEAIIPNLSSWSRSRTRPQTGFMIWTNTPEERPVSRFLSEQETGASA